MKTIAGRRTQATTAKNSAREILPGSLRAIANYVQGVSNNDLATLGPSGSRATDNGKAQSSLDKRGIRMIDSEASKQWEEVAVLLLWFYRSLCVRSIVGQRLEKALPIFVIPSLALSC